LVLHLARRDGWTVHGVELFPEQATLVRETLGLDVEAADLDSYHGTPASWDVVILTHVLEHLSDPVGALRKIRDLLKPAGIGVLEFPNIDALDALVRRFLRRTHLHRHRYPPDYVPGHVQEFCHASFALAAERAGLLLEHWETYAVNPLKYALYRQVPLGNKARVLVRRLR
jgi:SAM-dependent methyltransferase